MVLAGTAQFNTGRDGKTVVKANRHRGRAAGRLLLPVPQLGRDFLVMARIGAGPDKSDMCLNPDATPIPERAH